jgi:hypothetical protein
MKLAYIAVTTAAILVPSYASFAQDPAQSQTRQANRDRDIYGSQLMTPEERNEYRSRMRAAKTAQEREEIRAEHHAEMQKRAEARGVTLPDAPAARGGGMMGPGGGMGPGNGMGPGGGMGRGR